MQKPRIRISTRARRWRLSVDAQGGVELCWPAGLNPALADEVLWAHRAWIARHQRRQCAHFEQVRAAYDARLRQLPLLGEWVALTDRPEALYRHHAQLFFAQWCDRFCQQLQVRYRRITIRDPKTRWGSCSVRGNLSFSWRLMKAPVFVARYVAAHECGHLVHPNHSSRFWALMAELTPDYPRAQQWLKEQAAFLHYDPWRDDGRDDG